MLITKKYMNIVVTDEYSHTDFVERENGCIVTSILINDGDVYITVIDAKDVDEAFNAIDVKEERYKITLKNDGEVELTINDGEKKKTTVFYSLQHMLKDERGQEIIMRHDYRHLFGDGLEMVKAIFEEYDSLHS